MIDKNNPDIDAMKAVDIRNVDKSQLVDLNTVKIDDTKPVSERVESFLQQINNPYCFKIGDVAVKVYYKSEGPTFQQSFENMLKTL